MKNVDILRAWKDETYLNSLTAEQRAALPANPAGELSSVEAELIAGGNGSDTCTYTTCGIITISLTGGSGCDECQYQ